MVTPLKSAQSTLEYVSLCLTSDDLGPTEVSYHSVSYVMHVCVQLSTVGAML